MNWVFLNLWFVLNINKVLVRFISIFFSSFIAILLKLPICIFKNFFFFFFKTLTLFEIIINLKHLKLILEFCLNVFRYCLLCVYNIYPKLTYYSDFTHVDWGADNGSFVTITSVVTESIVEVYLAVCGNRKEYTSWVIYLNFILIGSQIKNCNVLAVWVPGNKNKNIFFSILHCV